MSNDQTIDDLNYAAALAKSGNETPLMGGPIGLMWGVLISATLFSHWAIINGVVDIEPQYLWALWFGFAAVGGIGSGILGRRLEAREGANSMANQIEQALWIRFALMGGSLWLGIVVSLLMGLGSVALFDLVPIILLAGQGLVYGVIAKFSNHQWLNYASGASYLSVLIAFSAYGQPHFYLVVAAAALVTVVLPSLKTMQNDHANR
ncbi:MAG: hypothetical protein ACPHVT_06030 [Porticoccaceae bacterium]